jgi:hypothetical protein
MLFEELVLFLIHSSSSYRDLFLWDLFGFIKKIPVHFEINPTCPPKCG